MAIYLQAAAPGSLVWLSWLIVLAAALGPLLSWWNAARIKRLVRATALAVGGAALATSFVVGCAWFCFIWI